MVTNSGSRVASSSMRVVGNLPAFVVGSFSSTTRVEMPTANPNNNNLQRISSSIGERPITTSLRDSETPIDFGTHNGRSSSSSGSSSTSNHHHGRHFCMNVTTTTSKEEPVLLLEGDEFYVSNDGIARTFYSLDPHYTTFQQQQPITIEEYYHLASARKQFVLRKQSNGADKRNDERNPISSLLHPQSNQQQPQVLSQHTQGMVPLDGSILNTFEFHEIDNDHETPNMFDPASAGTGASTWESSIAMSMYFSMHSNLLVGNILELGSGVGLGGVLLGQVAAGQSSSSQQSLLKSITLTDCNEKVLDQCWNNIHHHTMESSTTNDTTQFHVESLDWYDYAPQTSTNNNNNNNNNDHNGQPKERQQQQQQQHQAYDTIIASDVAYLYPDIVALSNTIATLLRKPNAYDHDDQPPQAHIFGPYNRGALYGLITQLKEQHGFNVVIDWIEMNRYRLKPPQHKQQEQRHCHSFLNCSNGGTWDYFQNVINLEEKECPFASKNTAKFIHIIASHPSFKEKVRTNQAGNAKSNISMEDID